MVSFPKKSRFVLCLENNGYEASLEVRKVYTCLFDADAEGHGMLRIVDESGEDYLFPAERFVEVDLPKEAEAVMQASC